MTIRKGADWGRLGPVPDGLVVVDGNAALFEVLNRPERPAAIGLRSGDLARTLGAGGVSGPAAAGDRFAPGAEVVIVTVDLGLARFDHGERRFAAHAIARRSWWTGALVGALNAQYVGRWDVAPRGHPNDGWVEVVEVDPRMSVRQRWAARSRLPSATHVPHPMIRTRRVRVASWTFERPQRLFLDGVPLGLTRSLEIEVEPDALTVCV